MVESSSPLFWPPDKEPPLESRVELECPGCGQNWYVHSDLGGHQLECHCGTWIQVPGQPQDSNEIESKVTGKEDSSISVGDGFASDGQLNYPTKKLDDEYDSGNYLRSLESSEVLQTRLRASWTNRTLVEFILVMLALLGPQVLLFMLVEAKNEIALMPFSSLASGVLILLIGLTASQFTYGGMRTCESRYLVEAVLVAVVFAMLAYWWMQFLFQFPWVEDPLPLGELRKVLGLGGGAFLYCGDPSCIRGTCFSRTIARAFVFSVG